MKKLLLWFAITLGFVTSISEIGCTTNTKTYTINLLLSLPKNKGYRLQFDNDNNWYVASDKNIFIGKEKKF